MTNNSIQIRLETIKYGGWDSLEVAIDVNEKPSKEGTKLYITFPTGEHLLGYQKDVLRKKIASKSLKAFLGKDIPVGKFSGFIVNKRSNGTATVSLLLLEDFIKIAVWEASVNQNISIAKLIAGGFEDSFRSLAFIQMGIPLDEDQRHFRLNRIQRKGDPWEKLYQREMCDKIMQWFGYDCSKFYWWYCYSWMTKEERDRLNAANPLLRTKSKSGTVRIARPNKIHQHIEPSTKERLKDLAEHLWYCIDFCDSRIEFEKKWGRKYGTPEQLELFDLWEFVD